MTSLNTKNETLAKDFYELLKLEESKFNSGENFLVGQVIKKERDHIIVDVGGKNEGRISMTELGDKFNEISIGSRINVYAENQDGGRNGGVMILSREKAIREAGWKRVLEIFESGESVIGYILGKVKGGFAVQLCGWGDNCEGSSEELGNLIAFLPGSQVDRQSKVATNLKAKQLYKFRVMKLTRESGNILISRKLPIEEARSDVLHTFLTKEAKPGLKLKGVVKNCMPWGVFVSLTTLDGEKDFGDGLVYVTEMSWERVDPSSMCNIGDNVEVSIIKYDPISRRLSLSMKDLQEDPWKDMPYKVGDIVKARIDSIVDYGAFATIDEKRKISGLIHLSEMSWWMTRRNVNSIVHIGQEIFVKILEIRLDERRMGLSKKQAEENPWVKFIESVDIGKVINVVVRNITDFGLFVALEESEDDEKALHMLVPMIECSWGYQNEHLLKYTKGDKIKVAIINTNVDKGRVTCSLRYLEKDKAMSLIQEMISKEYVEAKVIKVNQNVPESSILLELCDGFFTVYMDFSELPDNTPSPTVGSMIKVKIFPFDYQASKSLKATARLDEYDAKCALLKEQVQQEENLNTAVNNGPNKK